MPSTAEVDAALLRFAALDEKELAQPWLYRDKPMDVRIGDGLTLLEARFDPVTITIQGSGFLPSAAVTLDGKLLADAMTLAATP